MKYCQLREWINYYCIGQYGLILEVFYKPKKVGKDDYFWNDQKQTMLSIIFFWLGIHKNVVSYLKNTGIKKLGLLMEQTMLSGVRSVIKKGARGFLQWYEQFRWVLHKYI